MRRSTCALLAAFLLAGCGGGEESDTERASTTEETDVETVREPPEPRVPEGAVAAVGGDAIEKREFRRWLRIARATGGGTGDPTMRSRTRPSRS